MTLPGADEMFFRPSDAETAPETETEGQQPAPETQTGRTETSSRPAREPGGKKVRPAPKPSGRQRHDEKITVYVSAPELLALEQARLSLRAEHGLSADRGRLVREAVAVLLTDFEENGQSSLLVRRLAED